MDVSLFRSSERRARLFDHATLLSIAFFASFLSSYARVFMLQKGKMQYRVPGLLPKVRYWILAASPGAIALYLYDQYERYCVRLAPLPKP
jgi:hypothetical protein